MYKGATNGLFEYETCVFRVLQFFTFKIHLCAFFAKRDMIIRLVVRIESHRNVKRMIDFAPHKGRARLLSLTLHNNNNNV